MNGTNIKIVSMSLTEVQLAPPVDVDPYHYP
jgi:hypothetical protein